MVRCGSIAQATPAATRAAASKWTRVRPIGASGQKNKFLNHHLDPVLLRNLCIAVCEQIDVDLFSTGGRDSGREFVAPNRAPTRVLGLERQASRLPPNRMCEVATRHGNAVHICRDVQWV